MMLIDLSKGSDCWPDDLVAKLGAYNIKKKGEKGLKYDIIMASRDLEKTNPRKLYLWLCSKE